jgi:hypothetical protein
MSVIVATARLRSGKLRFKARQIVQETPSSK